MRKRHAYRLIFLDAGGSLVDCVELRTERRGTYSVRQFKKILSRPHPGRRAVARIIRERLPRPFKVG